MSETSYQRQTQNKNNQDTTQPKTVEQTLTQEDKMNVEIIKRRKPQCLLSGTKTGNSQSRKWKNKRLINKYPIELRSLIYVGAKLVCEKVGLPMKNKNKMTKPRWEIKLKTQIRNLRQRTKMIRLKNNMRCWDTEAKATQLQKIQ